MRRLFPLLALVLLASCRSLPQAPALIDVQTTVTETAVEAAHITATAEDAHDIAVELVEAVESLPEPIKAIAAKGEKQSASVVVQLKAHEQTIAKLTAQVGDAAHQVVTLTADRDQWKDKAARWLLWFVIAAAIAGLLAGFIVLRVILK